MKYLKLRIKENLANKHISKVYRTMDYFVNFDQYFKSRKKDILKTFGDTRIYGSTIRNGIEIACFDNALAEEIYEKDGDPDDAFFIEVNIPLYLLERMGYERGDSMHCLDVFFEYFPMSTGIYVAIHTHNVSKKEMKKIDDDDYSAFERATDHRKIIEPEPTV